MRLKSLFFLVLLGFLWYLWPNTGEVKKLLSDQSSLMGNPDLGKLPLYFIVNKGQVNERARFYARGSKYTLWLTSEGLVFDSTRRMESGTKFERDVSCLAFVGANKSPEMIPEKEAKARVNFFIGNDPSKWYGDVPTSLSVLYKNLYKNIDLKVYGVEKQIEYDWIVKPGGNPGDICFEYQNVKGTQIDEQGNLLIETDFGELEHRKPICYQDIDNQRRPVAAEFKRVRKNVYGFSVGKYDKNHNLIIDPVVLAYSTYLGGTGVDYNWSMDIDNNGNVYTIGYTSSTNFPVKNQYQSEPGDSNTDVFVSKIDTTKSGLESLVYSTYLGGSSVDEGLCITVDMSGIAYVTGYTNSSNFPIKNQYQSDQAGEDVFLVKLDTNQNGAASLLYSTYLGGSEVDRGQGVAIDNSSNAYITGYTDSANFPIKNYYQSNLAGRDVFVTKIDTNEIGSASLIYSTYLGGEYLFVFGSGDEGSSIAVDNSGNAYVTGFTLCSDFPIKNQYQSHPGLITGNDIFLTKIDTTQSGTDSLVYSTYLGGHGDEAGYDIAIDNSGNAYVTGYTDSTDFPKKNQYQSAQGGYDAFITRIDTNQSGTASLIYSTYLGGGGGEEGLEIVADNSSNVYVTGYTASSNFPLRDYYQSNQPDKDAFIIKLDTAQSGDGSLIYSTYLGGDARDAGKGIALDANGNLYVSGLTASSNFPILNQYQSNPDSTDDVFITRFSSPRIDIFIPNGGESFEAGSIQDITWSSIGVNGNVKIEYSIDGGNNWSVMVSSTENDGSYSWTVPGTLSNQCLVRISETDGSPSSTSASVFSIIPSIIVNFPNGGESFEGGSIQNITWSSFGIDGNVKIEYSIDEGSNWSEIVSSAPNSGSYTWVIPINISNLCLVRISETDGSLSDTSNAVFSIIPPHGTITVVSPNGGENLEVNSIHNITWTTTGSIGLINIDYSLDNGVNWTSILYSSNYISPYPWQAPGSLSSNCLVRVSETNNFVYDISNNVFSIVPVASITLTSPVGGEQWEVGSMQNITWSTTGAIANVKLEYSYFDGSSQTDWITITPSTQNDGSYQWTVPNTPGNGCILRVSDVDGTPADINNVTFSILPTPEIRVTYPNGNETLEVETQHNITWNSIGIVGNYVKIEYSTNNGGTWTVINSSATNSGSYLWTVPKVVPSGQCLIRISDTDGSPVDTSDSTFIIYSDHPFINVTYPNGGETIIGLSLQNITWASYNLYGYIKIEYSSDGGYIWNLIDTNIINVGSYPWSVPNGPLNICYVRVSSVDGAVVDSSSNSFSISQVPSRIPEIERRALIDLYNSTIGDSWINKSGWKTPPLHTDGFAMPGTENSWYGVTVIGNSYVERIRLRANNLSGPIPYSIGDFSHLVEIDFYSNKLNGYIPTSIGKLSLLQYLSLQKNQITGVIPDTIGNLQSIIWLYLHQNQLYGPIPSTTGNLSNLSSLILADNQLSGNIPPEIGNLANLTLLNLGKNSFNGNIPSEFGNLSHLQYLQLYQNLLSGDIPVSIGNLTNLLYIELSSNSLSGNIPSVIGNLSNLSYLALNDNQLEGSIPTSFGNLTGLISLILDNNRLSESIPTELGNLLNLSELKLQSNKLTGSIPISLANLSGLGNLWTDIGYNALYTNDETLRTFLSSKDSDWSSTQTIAPGNVLVSPVSSTSVQVSWTPIIYTADSGGYQVYFSTTPGGPYTLFDTTANKTISSMTVTGLTPVTPYYFVIRTRTEPHTNNQNIVESEYSDEVSVNTPPTASIDVIYPDGSENLEVGSIQNIRWSTAGIVGNLKIEYSINNGSDWIEIISSTENDGSFLWSTPNTPSNQCLIRISEIDGSPANISNGVFSIVHSPNISGWIKSGGIGLANVVMNGLPYNPKTDSSGHYASVVSYGWSGMVTPTLEGYTFSEPSTTYTNVISDQLTDYNATLLTYTISGTVTHGGIGLANVAIFGLPGNPITNTSGFYTSTVSYGWSGTAVPTLTNYNFTPSSTNYSSIAANQTSIYTAELANQIPTIERQALIDLYNSTNGDGWANNSGWKTPPLQDGFAMPGSEESWFGIAIESTNHVSSIMLGSNGLAGTIPASISNLSYLKELNLYTNQLTGTIPISIGLLQYLETLDMGNNQLSGSIPTEIGNLANLRLLYLYSNQLTGNIPSSIGNCVNLIRLYLDDNQLIGRIPQTICNLTKLERFDFSGNNIIGNIPGCITNLTTLANSFSDIDYNGLYVDDENTRSFLNTKAPGWEETQTIAPSNVTANPMTCSSIQLNWTPISYTTDVGSYEVYFSTTAGGTYTLFKTTSNKNACLMGITDLIPNTTYYFVVRTVTEPHGDNQNRVVSDYSNEVSATTFSATPGLTLAAPNGGEIWEVGSFHLITWTSSGNSGDIKIEYSTDNGVTWDSVVSLTANDGIYNWKLPNTPSITCLVKISTVDGDMLLSDVSDGDFSITTPSGPTITITSPNGKEELVAGTVHEITWTDTGISGNVRIEYSTNKGQSWEIIQASLVNEGSYNWTVPNTPSSICLVRVCELDSVPFDVSDEVFSIFSTPTITVTSPNGGESWEVESGQNITWTSIGIKGDVKLEYSSDNGASWELIAASAPNNGIYAWTIPNVLSNNCLVRISEVDPDQGISDVSNSAFSIISAGPLALIFPNGRETLKPGEDILIKWSSDPGVGPVKLEYSIDKGSIYHLLQKNLANTGNWNWSIPQENSTNCLVRISQDRGVKLDHNNLIYEFKFKIFGPRSQVAGGEALVFWLGDYSDDPIRSYLPKISILRSAAGKDQILINNVETQIGTLSAQWNRLKVLLDRGKRTITVWLNKKVVLKGIPLFSGYVFDPSLSLYAGYDGCTAIGIDNLTVKVFDSDERVKQSVTLFSEDFNDFKEKTFPTGGGWKKIRPDGSDNEHGGILIRRDLLPIGNYLKIKASRFGVKIAVKEFSMPESFPFDVSDSSFKIGND